MDENVVLLMSLTMYDFYYKMYTHRFHVNFSLHTNYITSTHVLILYEHTLEYYFKYILSTLDKYYSYEMSSRKFIKDNSRAVNPIMRKLSIEVAKADLHSDLHNSRGW